LLRSNHVGYCKRWNMNYWTKFLFPDKIKYFNLEYFLIMLQSRNFKILIKNFAKIYRIWFDNETFWLSMPHFFGIEIDAEKFSFLKPLEIEFSFSWKINQINQNRFQFPNWFIKVQVSFQKRICLNELIK
jgi:hypothetical protein